jgi:hypothetical protein
MWFGGMPFTRAYQPGLHYTISILSRVSGLSIPSAYHALTAVAYAFGGVAFYFLVKGLTKEPLTAFTGAMLFSMFSPSTLLLPLVRIDAGGFLGPRRLQALIGYGEGPNVTGLTLAIFALAAVHRALGKRTAFDTCLAGLAVAVVPVVSWPATVALLMALVAYTLALHWDAEFRERLLHLLIIGVLGIGFALPFAPPSTIAGTFSQTRYLGDAPSLGPARWILLGLLFLCLAILRALLIRFNVSFATRFAALWTLFVGWIVMAVPLTGTFLLPSPMRFHIAMEIAISLTAVLAGRALVSRRPRAARILVAATLVSCVFQIWSYRHFVRVVLQRIDITKTPEYDLAKWSEANLAGQRIFTLGTFAYWLNAFTETPQAAGFFDISLSNFQDRVESYVIAAGYTTNQDSADYSLLWLKAWAANAIQMGGPQTANAYKDFLFPNRFRGALPIAWSRGDDVVYLVPNRAKGLARVVRARDLVQHPPVNGVDVKELRPFVQALDDRSLPQARFHWQDPNTASISGTFAPDQVVEVAINHHPGWTATANGHEVPVHADGLGLIAIEPHCTGGCQIEMHWSAGWEPIFTGAAFLLAFSSSLVWCWVARSRVVDKPREAIHR